MINPIDKILDASNFDFDWVKYNVNPSYEFIYLKFKECELIKLSNGYTKYIDPNGTVLFLDNIESDEKEKVLYFSYGEIYKKLKEMGLSYNQMKDLIKDMLWEIYKRKVDRSSSLSRFFNFWLWEKSINKD